MNETIEKVFEYIDIIAAKLGVASEHVYGTLVKKSLSTGIAQIGLALILVGIYIFIWKYFLKRKEEVYSNVYNDKRFDQVTPFLVMGGIVIFIIAIVNLYIGVLKVVNPEYYAMKEIMTLLKGE